MSATMNDIFKDVNSIWARLFDHRVFLNGEIQFTLREYEQKRGDIEVAYLFSLLENIGDLKAVQIDRITESINNTLSQSSSTLEETLSICNSIIESEETYDRDSRLELAKDQRKLEWENFVDNITSQCKTIDNTFEQKQAELQKLYEDLQRRLSSTSN